MKNLPQLFTVLLTVSVAAVGCDSVTEATPQPGLAEAEAALIYGSDDRIEVFAASPAAQSAADSVVGLFFNVDVSSGGGGYVIATPTTMGESKDLCSSEPFAEQPDTAFCTGFLVADDVIATAGHCITDAADCGNTTFVFGWRMENASTARTTVAPGDVYTCSQIIGRSDGSADWALVRTDRPVVGHAVLPVRTAASVSLNDPTHVIGHPFGIPAKVGSGGTVQGNSNPDFFGTNLDSYAGNSGSPVFNAAFNAVEGILVRGNTDLVGTGRGKKRCYVSNVCADTGCGGTLPFEEVTRSTVFAHLINSTPPPACLDDAYEPNDVYGDALSLARNGSLSGLEICSGDEDWFSVWVEEGEVLTATIDFDHSLGDLSLELRDVTLGLIDASTGSGNSETAASVPRAFGGTVYIVTKGVAGAQTEYTLTTALDGTTPPPGGTCGDNVCDADESCDGRSGTSACSTDCAGQLGGKKKTRYCYVGSTCEGSGCP
ncbi:MAG: hypothetical protein ACI9MR_002633 [Myxococcota bacterium]|jgi:hypothetical protein